MSSRRHPRAFTLIELLLVIVILGILASLVLPRMIGKTKDAQIGAAKAQIAILEGSLARFELDNSRFPTSEEGLDALVTAPAGLDTWKGPYMEKGIPNDPWKKPYIYRTPGTRHPDFDLYSGGPDGLEGTEDDVWSDNK